MSYICGCECGLTCDRCIERDHVAPLRAENARLRKAVEKALSMEKWHHMGKPDDYSTCAVCRQYEAALARTEGEEK